MFRKGRAKCLDDKIRRDNIYWSKGVEENWALTQEFEDVEGVMAIVGEDERVDDSVEVDCYEGKTGPESEDDETAEKSCERWW